MDNGVFQLLFFALLILASVFDGIARRRKRQRRMEEMEWEEEAEGEDGVESGTSSSAPSGSPARTGAPAGERETADSMVPDDLWAILTGEERPGAGRGLPPVPDRDEAVAAEPVPGSVERAESLPERSGGRDPGPPPWATMPPPSESPPAWRPAPPPPTARTPATPARVPRRTRSLAPSRREASMTRAQAFPAASEDTAKSRSMYVELLREGGVNSLRQAIVLAEVFGTPVALRPPGRDGNGFS